MGQMDRVRSPGVGARSDKQETIVVKGKENKTNRKPKTVSRSVTSAKHCVP